MYKVQVTGFHTEEEAKDFIAWYEAWGSQILRSRIGYSMNVDFSKSIPARPDETHTFTLPLLVNKG